MVGLALLVLGFGFGFACAATLATLVERVAVVGRTPDWVVAVAMSSGAATGAWAPSRPTGSELMDISLRCGFGACVAFFATRARRRSATFASAILLVPIAVEAVRGRGSAAVAVVAAASTAFAVARWVFPQRVPVVGTIAGVGTSFSILRLPTSLPFGAPSAVAFVAVALLAASAWTVFGRTARRRVRASALLLGSAVLVAAAAAVVVVVYARPHAELGLDRARAGLDFARAGDIEAATASFAASRDSLERSNRWLSSPGARLAALVPVVAQHVAALRDLTATAVLLADTASETAGQADLDALRDQTTSSPSINLAKVEELRDGVDKADIVLTKARAALGKRASPWLVPPLTQRIDVLRDDVRRASESTAEATRLLEVVPGLVGADEPRRYLMVLVTPSEARGSGGLIGNFAELTAVDGKISLTRIGRNAQLVTGGLPPDQRVLRAPKDWVDRYKPWGAPYTWANLNMGPDFPTTAAILADQYPQSGGQPVDGVISADPIALAGMLRLLGPVEVSGWPEPLTADNIAEVLLYRAYVDIGGDSPERVQMLAAVTQAAWTGIGEVPIPSPQVVASALRPAVAGRHLQIWMSRPKEQDLMVRAGLSGTVPPIAGDGLGVIVNNASVSKLEWFLRRAINADIVVNPATGDINSDVTIVLRNDAPKGGSPSYPLGFGTYSDVGTNRLYVSVYSPLQLNAATLNGVPIQALPQFELGRNVYSFWIWIPPQGTQTLRLELSGRPSLNKKTYRFDLFTQPLVHPDDASVAVRSTTGQVRGMAGLSGSGTELRTTLQPSAVETFIVDLSEPALSEPTTVP